MVRSALGNPKTHYGASEIFSRVSGRGLFPLAAGSHRVMGFDSPEFTSDPSVYRFTGKELDPDSIALNVNNARYHFPARTYVPFRAGFLQYDPLLIVINANSWLYARSVYAARRAHRIMHPYAIFQPTVAADPMGLQENLLEKFEGCSVGQAYCYSGFWHWIEYLGGGLKDPYCRCEAKCQWICWNRKVRCSKDVIPIVHYRVTETHRWFNVNPCVKDADCDAVCNKSLSDWLVAQVMKTHDGFKKGMPCPAPQDTSNWD